MLCVRRLAADSATLTCGGVRGAGQLRSIVSRPEGARLSSSGCARAHRSPRTEETPAPFDSRDSAAMQPRGLSSFFLPSMDPLSMCAHGEFHAFRPPGVWRLVCTALRFCHATATRHLSWHALCGCRGHSGESRSVPPGSGRSALHVHVSAGVPVHVLRVCVAVICLEI